MPSIALVKGPMVARGAGEEMKDETGGAGQIKTYVNWIRAG
jgi:hypothetical protein